MPRAVWSGSITFGLVNVGVKAFTAVHDHRVRFHQLEKGTGARVRHQKVSSTSGKPLEADEIERGFELHKGEFVVVDPDELDELRPASTRTIEISDFVALEDVDPVFYNATYWLAPDGDAAARSYRLLLAALEDRDRVGVGTVVMRNVQYLAAVRPLQGALALSTMRFADEVVDRKDLDGIPSAKGKVAPKELALANQIIDALQAEWKPERYHDTYTEELHDLIRRKAKGETIEAPEPAAETAKVTDLMEALRASVERAGTRRKARPTSRGKGASRPRAKKAAGSSTRKRRAQPSGRRSAGGGKTSK